MSEQNMTENSQYTSTMIIINNNNYFTTTIYPLIQDNLGEPVPETIRHINPPIITILLHSSTQSSPFTHLLSLTSNSSHSPPPLPSIFSLVSSRPNTFNHKIHTFLHPLTVINNSKEEIDKQHKKRQLEVVE